MYLTNKAITGRSKLVHNECSRSVTQLVLGLLFLMIRTSKAIRVCKSATNLGYNSGEVADIKEQSRSINIFTSR